MTYRISTVAEMTGIPRNTLIAWERRYGLLKPDRQTNGYRQYTEQDVAQLLRLKNALNTGLKISEAIALVKPSSPDEPPPVGGIAELTGSPFGELTDSLFDALVSYQGAEAQRVLARSLTIPFETRLQEIYFPVLRRIGDGWSAGELTVAQEHFASGIIKAHLATVFINTSHASLSAEHSMCTTLPHDEHEIAALALSIQLSMKGHRVSYLGSKLPLPDLVDFWKKQNPSLICVSCITLPPENDIRQYIDALEPIAAAGTRVVLGGQCLSPLRHEGRVEVIPNWRDLQAQ